MGDQNRVARRAFQYELATRRSLSCQYVAAQRVERAAALLAGGGFRQRCGRTEDIAQRWTGRPPRLSLLGRVADFRQHDLGVLVAGLQLLRDRRWNTAAGTILFDIFEH